MLAMTVGYESAFPLSAMALHQIVLCYKSRLFLLVDYGVFDCYALLTQYPVVTRTSSGIGGLSR
jgi:hypothetical protein